MRCIRCGNELPDLTIVCPYCNTQLTNSVQNAKITNNFNNLNNINSVSENKEITINTQVVNTGNNIPVKQTVVINNIKDEVSSNSLNNKQQNNDKFFIIVIVVGLIVFSILLFFTFYKPKEKENKEMLTTTTTAPLFISNNKGERTTYNYPYQVGGTTLASIYDEKEKKYSDVDVTGVRFIVGEEANIIASTYAKEALYQDFEWVVFEYKVKLNDLNYLNNRLISPKLESTIYKWDGCPFVIYNGENYNINLVSIYEGNGITNNQSDYVKVLYQLPINQFDYSICLGNNLETMGCFSR